MVLLLAIFHLAQKVNSSWKTAKDRIVKRKRLPVRLWIILLIYKIQICLHISNGMNEKGKNRRSTDGRALMELRMNTVSEAEAMKEKSFLYCTLIQSINLWINIRYGVKHIDLFARCQKQLTDLFERIAYETGALHFTVYDSLHFFYMYFNVSL